MQRRVDFARIIKMRKRKLFGKQVCFLLNDFQDATLDKEWDALIHKILMKRYINKTKKMIFYKWFYEPVYKMNYYFVVCKDQNDFIKIIKKHYNIDISFTEGGYGKSIAITNNDIVVLGIWVKTYKSIPEFAHELTHTLIGLFETIDHPLKANNDEPIAYLAEYLTKQFIDKKGWKSANEKARKN